MLKLNGGGKVLGITIIVLLFGVVAFFGGRYILYIKIRNTIETELANLRDQEIDVQYDHMEVYPWKGKIEFLQLVVRVNKDSLSTHGLVAVIPYVYIAGIDLIPFIRNKTLSMHIISAQNSQITYAQGATLFEHDSTSKRQIELKNISVGRIELPGLDVYVKDTVAKDTLSHMLASIVMEDIFLHKQQDSMVWQRGFIKVNDFAMRAYKEDYGFSVQNVQIGIRDRSISMDSIVIKPVLSKNAYMAKQGKQSTYMDAFVRSVRVTGIEWFVYPYPAIDIDKILVDFRLDSYRDKRLPFMQEQERPLPVQALQKLPFRINIDTIRIRNSYVRYEEFPEKGDSSGSVYFEKLHATIQGLHNNPKLKKEFTMKAYARFMGSGVLNAQFSFPYDTLKAYRVSGTLRKMPLADINQMLGSAAKTRIESGMMETLKFHFAYTSEKSSGQVQLNYQDLKIQYLRENRKNEQSVSLIKTLLLNTFIKKDMDEDVADDKRTGQIDFERDKKRSVFNYWWKSVFSGIKAAYIENLPIVKDPQKKKKKKKTIKDIWSQIF